jgi:predicted nucleic acid-binding Zn ribbon protein
MRQSLEALLDDLGSAPVRATSSLVNRWAEVVGPELADHTEPVGVREGTLVVHADDPAYGERLAWDERRLLGRLASVLGEGVVTRVQVRTRR